MSDLQKRLAARNQSEDCPFTKHCSCGALVNPDGPEAADRIDQLEAEVKRYRAALTEIELMGFVIDGHPCALISRRALSESI
jgi:hypothetical protein